LGGGVFGSYCSIKNTGTALALLGLCLFIISVDRLIDGQTWRVALYAVVSLIAIVAVLYGLVRGRKA
jgi:hypothetical protein